MTAAAGDGTKLTAELAVPGPLQQLFSYSVPPALEAELAVGSIAEVSFGRRLVAGVVVGLGPPPAGVGPLKPIRRLLEPGPAVPADVLELARWAAGYYLAPLGELVQVAIPAGSRLRRDKVVAITSDGSAELARLGRLEAAERRLLETLAERGPLATAALARACRLTDTPRWTAALLRRGLVTLSVSARPSAVLDVERTLELVDSDLGRALEACGRSPRARELVVALAGESGPVGWRSLRGPRALPWSVVRRLAERGIVRIAERVVDRDALASVEPSAPKDVELTEEQREAVALVVAGSESGSFLPVLLHGVTGSGKTRVYIECARRVLAAGRGVMLLVPEIGLTPLLSRELKGAFGDDLALLHSGLTPGQRYDAWRRLRSGAVRVVLGTRSAVFAPVVKLGLIVIDEEHDASYKQDRAPHYHARDMAVMRAKLAGIPVVLGSATPALETMTNALSGRYRLASLSRRVLGRNLPEVAIVDMRAEYASAGRQVMLSERLETELELRLERGEQALLLLNRRGYAAFVVCRECGQSPGCPRCSLSLSVHLKEARVRCHACGYWKALPKRCAFCAGDFLQLVGQGTEKVEEVVRRRFPSARSDRLDRDSVRGRADYERILGAFADRSLDILVGTQMIAKGHDFPYVTLVGVVSVDAGLAVADFRATERSFQLLTQVAGRAGRGDTPGQVVIQTYHPDNEAVRLAAIQDYASFYEREARIRRIAHYPPYTSLVNILVSARKREVAEARAGELCDRIRASAPPALRILGPALAPVERIRYEWRAQILVRSADRQMLRRAVAGALEGRPIEGDVRIDVDVDPVHLL